MKTIELFNTLPKPMKAYHPNPLAQNESPAKRASDLNHVWVKSGAWRYIFDENARFLFAGIGEDIRLFYSCSPTVKYKED